jgi:hypothetical protein
MQPLKIVSSAMPGTPRFWREDIPLSLGPEEYRRVAGGLAWPMMGLEGAGCWCVLGEVRLADSHTEAHEVRVLASGMDDSVAVLLDDATAAASALNCGAWYAPLNEPGQRLYIEWRKSRRKLAQPVITLAHPPHTDFTVLFELLKARTKGQKSFAFGEHGAGPASAVKELDAEATTKPIKHYPQVAALLYALGAIDLLSPPSGNTKPWHRGRAGY